MKVINNTVCPFKLYIRDLEPGEVFRFADTVYRRNSTAILVDKNDVFLRTSIHTDIVRPSDGAIMSIRGETDLSTKPVRRVNATLTWEER